MPAISDLLPIQAPTPASSQRRPGRVVALEGVIFQSDAASAIGSWFIRPFEALDRRVAGLHRSDVKEPIAIHAALHVMLDDGREFVAEQLVGTAYEDLKNGLNWTPI